MPLDRLDFENLNEDDLNELLAAQVPESIRLDYKRTLYGSNEAGRKEFLKDVSAFANTQGGHLLIGIEETEGVPTNIGGLTENADAELLRMEQMIRDGLEPRPQNIRSQSVRLANGNTCLVLRIPKSWNAPHRVTYQGWNKFFIRNSRSNSEPNVQELRMLFTKNDNISRQAREFRDERIKLVTEGRTPRPLLTDGRLILHIVPLAALTSDFQLNLREVDTQRDRFLPLGSQARASRINFDGFINMRGGEENNGYLQIFRNGILEATKAPIVRVLDDGRRIINTRHERDIAERINYYMLGLAAVQVPPPFVVMITLEGVQGAVYLTRRPEYDDWGEFPQIDRQVLRLPEILIEDFGTELDYHRALKPAINALWNAAGEPEARFFNEEGRWVVPAH